MSRVKTFVGTLLVVQPLLFYRYAGEDKGRLKHHRRARNGGKGLFEMLPLLHSDQRLSKKGRAHTTLAGQPLALSIGNIFIFRILHWSQKSQNTEI